MPNAVSNLLPWFGRPDQAEGGKLFIAAAGSGDAVKRICPALDAMGQRTFVIGETPAQANLLKLSVFCKERADFFGVALQGMHR
jgi:hypothetical protein